MFTASVYFLGQYRPAHFEGPTAKEAALKAFNAVGRTAEAIKLQYWITEAATAVRRGMPSISIEHGALGVSIRSGAHNPFLDDITREFPTFPGLDYSSAANA